MVRVLADHLGVHDDPESHRRGRRYSTAASIAGLFSSYGDNRPAMLSDWAAGVDSDGTGQPLQHDLAWQPALWRELRERIGTPSPAERLTGACARLIDEPRIAGLPGRVSLFGLTRLPRRSWRCLRRWLPDGSPPMADSPQPRHVDELASRAPTARRADDDTAVLVSNPLLASLSRDVREMQQRLPATAGHIHYAASGTGGTVLAKLQNNIRNERRPGPDERIPADDSISIHACYGPARQVEVLRESILHLLENDDTLEPRDIIVMCPDVAMFAPLDLRGVRAARSRAPRTPAAGTARGPQPGPHQSAARYGRRPASPRRRPGDRQRGSRSRGEGPRGAAVPLHQREPGNAAPLDGRGGRPMGTVRSAAAAVRLSRSGRTCSARRETGSCWVSRPTNLTSNGSA